MYWIFYNRRQQVSASCLLDYIKKKEQFPWNIHFLKFSYTYKCLNYYSHQLIQKLRIRLVEF